MIIHTFNSTKLLYKERRTLHSSYPSNSNYEKAVMLMEEIRFILAQDNSPKMNMFDD
ncbi:MAG: hypothetical protein NZL83_01900 [Candidatus Absconditabacterales bacterium]|nr:hypothetical protein [Candidatus Absconditabacterales bacterium]